MDKGTLIEKLIESLIEIAIKNYRLKAVLLKNRGLSGTKKGEIRNHLNFLGQAQGLIIQEIQGISYLSK